jgi:hypothetical protein
MSLYFKSRSERQGRPSSHEVNNHARKRQVIVPKNPLYMDEVIDQCVGYKQSEVHKKLCLEFLGEHADVTQMFKKEYGDGFRPAEVLPGGEFTELLDDGLEGYKRFYKELEQSRRSGPVKWGYTPSEYMPFYTGWHSHLTRKPLENVSWQVMRFYDMPQGDNCLRTMNAHHYTIERWSGENAPPPAFLTIWTWRFLMQGT